MSSTPGIGPPIADRLARLAGEHALTGDQSSQLGGLLRALAQIDRPSTTIVAPAQAVDVHLADSLSAVCLACLRRAEIVVDIGSGAGFPGLPLAIARPDASFSLLESVGWRCDGIQALIDAAQIGNATVVRERAESWTPDRPADVVTARALAPLAVICEYAAPLLCHGGTLVAWKGNCAPDEERAAAAAAAELGLEHAETVRTEPYPGCVDHHLYLYVKARPTPARFPRRPGVARKRPLGLAR